MPFLPSPGSNGLTAAISFLGIAVCLASPLLAQTPRAEAPAHVAPADDPRPLSAAQIALFETPHLQNVRQPLTLDYDFVREGPEGFADKVAVHIRRVNADGSKDVSFDFLTGSRKVNYPELDAFRGNPLLMLVMERDVLGMKQSLGLSAAYFRNNIRESFVDRATVTGTEIPFEGRSVPARVISVQPFEHDDRFDRLPMVKQKRYVFTLADAVPGGIAAITIDMPGDPAMQLPPFSEKLSYGGTEP